MWQHNYTPIGGSLALSALCAAFPVFVLLLLIGVFRKPSWMAALSGLAAAIVVAVAEFGMPFGHLVSSIGYGAAFGLFPIGWIVFSAILLYNITVEMGKFEIVKKSVGNLTEDRRLQALLIAFAFGAFLEGAAGFGTPVAVAAAMMTGLGFSPFYAAGICLLANTAPVAFGSIGIPLTTLAGITSLPLDRLSAGVGRICAPVALIIPAYLVMVMGGWRALSGVLPAAIVCGVTFAGAQFVVSNYIGPELAAIAASLSAVIALVALMQVWKPKDNFVLEGCTPQAKREHIPLGEALMAWIPYVLLVVCVLAWGYKPLQARLNAANIVFPWPGLHNLVQRMPPAVNKPSPYGAIYTWNWLSAAGTACLTASILSAVVLGMAPGRFFRVFVKTVRQLLLAELTIATVLGLAFLMNYCGATATMGLAFAATGAMFPFFSALLGWTGVFLTGSDTSANALFGNLQVVTAHKLGMNPILMAASNSSGGVMGKMISLQSVAVAAAATSMPASEESKIFRLTLRHSVLLATIIGLIVVVYSYVLPGLQP
jgi:lactate permease